MRALVIDDSKTMRMIVSRILKEIGFDIVEAEHGKDGLDKLAASGPFDLAMVDWNMPEMNGYEFVQAAREDSKNADMKIMMVTTETELEFVAQALEAGADEYAMKPFTKEIILEKLALIGIETAQA